MKNYWIFFKNFIFFVIFILVLFFFYNEILRNYDSISGIAFKFNYGFLVLAGICIGSMFLSATVAWHVLINSVPIKKKLNFIQSFSIVNVSALLKYIPGKVWTYAVQLYLIRNLFISKQKFSLIFLIINLISLSIQTALGLFILIFLLSDIWLKLLLFLGCLILFTISFFVLDVANIIICLINKIFKKDFSTVRFSFRKILLVQMIYFFAIILFAASGYFVAIGIGMSPTFKEALSIASANLLSSVAGYVVIIAPAGLGVRELVMYEILDGVSNKSLALVLPIATRILMMLMDLIFGIFGLALFRAQRRKT
jgi:hypothetical protein